MKRDKIFMMTMVLLSVLLVCNASFAAPADRGKAAPKSALPGDLRNIDVKDYFIGAAARDVGVIQTVIGHAVVARGDMKQAYFAAPGDRLFEKDVVFTLKGSKCRFKLVAEDVVTMSENTRVGIKSFTDNRQTQAKSSSFTMNRGKAMFYALRLFKYKGSGMDVQTPTAVCGVRGTKFGMEVIEGGGTASLPVNVADASQGFMYLAQAGGSGTSTVTHSFEGYVDVTSLTDGKTQRITAGNSIEAGTGGLGTAFSTPPDVSRGFQSDTQVSAPDALSRSGGAAPAGGDAGAGASMGTGTTPDNTNLVQNQNNANSSSRPTKHDGYFTGMLTNLFSGMFLSYDKTYMSDTPQNFDSTDARADADSTSSMRVDGSGGSNKNMAELTHNESTATGLPQPIQIVELGYNAYMEWGYWTQPNLMNVSGSDYKFDNRGYYVWGDITAIMPSSISGTYSGTAHGTDWSSGGGVNKTGTFRMDVLFSGGSGSINNFEVWVGGTGNTGMTSGSGTISGSSFSVTSSNVKVNGSVGTSGYSGAAKGAFYGPNAEYTGGVWQVNNGIGGYANGMFQGAR